MLTEDLAFRPLAGWRALPLPSQEIEVDAESGGQIIIPDAHLMFQGEYHKSDFDLVIQDGATRLTIHDYFRVEKRPTLRSAEGATLAEDVIAALAMAEGGIRYAQAAPAATPAPIGRVETITGQATAIRNGTPVVLNRGDLVYKGDVVQTDRASSLGITFIDGSAFSLSASARMVLNEMVYQAGGTGNSALLNIVQGSVSFLAGQVAKSGDMKVGTPVATMGIRGTHVGADVNANDGTTKFSVKPDPNGEVGRFELIRDGRVIALISQAGEITTVTPAGVISTTPQTVAEQQADQLAIALVYQIVSIAASSPPIPGQPAGPAPGPSQGQGTGGSGSSSPPPADTGGTPTPPTLQPILAQILNSPSGLQLAVTVPQTTTTTASSTTQVVVPTPAEQLVTVITGTGGNSTAVPSTGQVIVQGRFGILIVQSDGTRSYAEVPPASLAQGETGQDTFTFEFRDSTTGTTRQETQTYSVAGVNDSPTVAAPIQAGATEGGGAATVDLLAGATDPDNGAALTIQNVTYSVDDGAPSSTAPSGVTLSGRILSVDPSSTAFNHIAQGASQRIVVTYDIVDGLGGKVSQTATIAVAGVNDAPTATAEVVSVTADETASGSARASGMLANDIDPDDGEAALLVVTGVRTGGAGASATFTNVATGSGTVLAGTYGDLTVNADGTYDYVANRAASLAAGATGTDEFTYRIADPHGAISEATIRFDVVGVNDTPVANPDTGSVTAGGTVSEADRATGLLANDTDPDDGETGDLAVTGIGAGNLAVEGSFTEVATGSATLIAGALGDLTVSADGSYSYAANRAAALAQGVHGTDVFTYRVADAGGEERVATLSFDVTGVNDTPTANVDVVAVTAENTASASSRAAGLLANDTDPDSGEAGSLAVIAIRTGGVAASGTFADVASGSGTFLSGAYGDLTVNADGTYSYVASRAAQLGDGVHATDTFTYRISDTHGATSETTLSFDVAGVNDAPVAIADAGSVTSGQSLSRNDRASGVLANDTDPDPGQTATLKVVAVRSGALPATALAQSYVTSGPALVNGLGGSAGFGESFVARNDDSSSGPIDITGVFGMNGLNFFGNFFTTIFVNNNGNITFTGSSSAFTPFPLTGSSTNPIIAAFFYDVDTRTGVQPATPGGNSTGSNLVYYDLDPVNHVVTVTWDDVGYFSGGTDALNAFQIQLIGTGNGDFEILFRYEASNYGGSSGARAGYSAGNGTNSFELPQSGDAAAMRTLAGAIGNTGQTGLWTFSARDGSTSSDQSVGASGPTTILGRFGTLTLSADGSYSYTADRAAILGQDQQAVDRFTYTVADAQGARDQASLDIAVTGINDGPFAAANSASVDAGQTASATDRTTGVLANDTDPDEGETARLVLDGFRAGGGASGTFATPGSGTFTDGLYGRLTMEADDGTYSYAANRAAATALGAGQSGTDTFTYRIADPHGARSTATLTFTVRGVNDGPDALADSRTVASGQSVGAAPGDRAAGVLGNDTDPDTGESALLVVSRAGAAGGTLDAVSAGGQTVQGAYGTLLIRQDGTYSYTANAGVPVGQTLTDTFSYEARDPSGSADIADLTFSITGTAVPNQPPLTTGPVSASGAEGSGTFTADLLSGATDPEGAALHVENFDWSDNATPGALPAGFSLSSDGRTVTVDANALAYNGLAQGGQSFASHFTYDVVDAQGGRTNQSATITIAGTNDAPTADAETVSVTAGQTASAVGRANGVLVGDTDPDSGETETLILTGFRAGGGTSGTFATPGSGTFVDGAYGRLSISSDDGSYSYVANNAVRLADGVSDTDVFTYQIKDVHGAASTATLTFNVTGVNDAPTARADVFPSVNEDATEARLPIATLLANDTDPDGDGLRVISVVGVTGGTATIDGTDVVFTPTPNFNGAARIRYTITDDHGGTSESVADFAINPVNDAPNLPDSPAAVTFTEGGAAVALLPSGTTTGDPDAPTSFAGASIHVTLANARAGDLLTLNNSLTGNPRTGPSNTLVFQDVEVGTYSGLNTADFTLNFNANAGQLAVDTFLQALVFLNTSDDPSDATRTATITFNDGGNVGLGGPLSDSTTVTVNVAPVNDAPVLAAGPGDSDAVTFADSAGRETDRSQLGRIGFTDPDSSGPFASSGEQVSSTNGTFLGGFGGAGIEPPKGVWAYSILGTTLDSLAAGETIVQTGNLIVLDEQQAAGRHAVTITLIGANDTPDAEGQSVSATEDTLLPITLRGSDVDRGDRVEFFRITSLSGGTLFRDAGQQQPLAVGDTITASGNEATLYFRPAPNSTAPASFTFVSNDGDLDSNAATVSVSISATDDAPTAVDDVATVAEDSGANSIDVLANDTDVDGGPKSIVSVTQPGHGAVAITGGGTGLTYTPNGNYFGSDTFTYTLEGGTSATVSVTVTAVDDPSSAQADSVSTQQDTPVTLTTLRANDDPDGGPAVIAGVGNATHGTVTLNGGNPIFTPEPGFTGTASFTYWLEHSGTPLAAGPLQPATSATVGANPIGVAIVDLNGDGRADLVAANSASGNVSVRLGNGDGTFQNQQAYGTGVAPFAVAVGDINSDGRLDIAVANINGGSVSILLGNGDGTFAAQQQSGAVFSSPEDVAVADLDRDGFTDIVVGNAGSNYLSVIRGNASGTFSQIEHYATPGKTVGVAVGDFNEDGKLDLVTTSYDVDLATVFLADSSGGFSASTRSDISVGDYPLELVVADFNGDGHLDFATANNVSSNVSVLLGTGTGTFLPQTTYSTGSAPAGIASADINQDGKADLVVTTASGASVLFGNGDGTFGSAVSYGGVGSSPGRVATGDLNGDGRADVIVSDNGSSNVAILLNTPAGDSSATVTVTVTPGPDTPPTAVNDSATVGEDSGANQIDVLANDTDADGGPKSIASVTQPTNGTVAITGGGTGLTYTPNASYAGSDTFTYTLNGGSIANVNVTVSAADEAPQISSPGINRSYTETNAPISDSGTIAFSDPDAGDTATARVGAIKLEITTGAGTTIAQYASSVIGFSSQYSPDDWSAQQALGGSNTDSYGDNSTAWAPASENGTTEYLSVGFAQPMYSTGVSIRETYGNGFVTRIDAMDANGGVQTVWTGTDPSQPGAPATFEPSWARTSNPTVGLTIYVDTDHNLSDYEEIDSVLLLDGAPLPAGAAEALGTAFAVDSSTGFWTFNLPSPDYLPSSATVTATYTVIATDTHGATASQAERFTVTGTNDAPVFRAGANSIGYVQSVEGDIFGLTGAPSSWTAAESLAEQVGGHLATFSSDHQDENAYANFSPYYARVPGNYADYWIGLTAPASSDFTNKANWSWIDGTPIYDHWHSGQPDGAHPAGGSDRFGDIGYFGDGSWGNQPDAAFQLNQGIVELPAGLAGARFGTLTALASIGEKDIEPSAQTVASFLGASVTDADAGASQGIAILGADQANGRWQFQLAENTSTWTDFGTYSDISALLLRSDDKVRFVPDGAHDDLASFDFVAWDRTSGQAGDIVNASVRGGSSAFSVDGSTAVIRVTPVDDPPLAVDDDISTDEDTPVTFDVLDNDDPDSDGGPVDIISVTQGAHGRVSFDSSITYMPDANYAGTDTFTYTLNGGSQATVHVTVTGVNDAPVARDDVASVTEDSSPSASGNLISSSDPASIDTDPEGDTLTISDVSGGSDQSGTFVSDGTYGRLSVDAATGAYTYTLGVTGTQAAAAQALGSGDHPVETFTYTVDDGHGGTDSAELRVTVNGDDEAPANAAPVIQEFTTERVSLDAAGAETSVDNFQAGLSRDGRYLTYTAFPNPTQIYLKDPETGALTRISSSPNGDPGDLGSSRAHPSADGRYVAFESSATNLVAGDTNNARDLFLYDRQTNSISRVSVSDDGSEANSASSFAYVSADGRYVAFASFATNLVANDLNDRLDVFVRDTVSNTTTRVSVTNAGTEATPSVGGVQPSDYPDPRISADGNLVFFNDRAALVADDVNNRQDVYVRDIAERTTTLVSLADDESHSDSDVYLDAISPDGRFVVFETSARLAGNETNDEFNIYLRDRQTGETKLVSVGLNGEPLNDYSSFGGVSADGRYVTFYSYASNVVAEDTNGVADIFVRDMVAGRTIRVSEAPGGRNADDYSFDPVISGDGSLIAFESEATNLGGEDTNGRSDVILARRGSVGTVTDDPSLTTLTTSGYFTFSDPDGSDIHTVTPTPSAGHYGTLTVTLDQDTGGTGVGRFTWNYEVDESLAKPLGAGQTHVDTFTLTLDDGAGGTATTDVHVTIQGVNDAPTVAAGGIDDQTAVEDQPYQLSAGDYFDDADLASGDDLTFSAKAGGGSEPLPDWLTIDPDTGELSGMPADGDVGNLSIEVTATDTHGDSASAYFALTVQDKDPVISAAAVYDLSNQVLTFDGQGAVDLSVPGMSSESAATVEFWMNMDQGGFPFGFYLYDVIAYPAGSYAGRQAVIGFNTGSSDHLAAEVPGLDSGWHHVAAVFNNGDVELSKLYVDGVLLTLDRTINGASPNQAVDVLSDTARIGGWRYDNQLQFRGSLDEVRIWGGERSQADIQANMNLRLEGPQPGSYGIYSFEQLANAQNGVTDTSGAGNHGTFVNGMSTTDARPELRTGSTAPEDDHIRLDVSVSDAQGGAFTYSWTQVVNGAPTVTFVAGTADDQDLEFISPEVTAPTDLVFELAATDEDGHTTTRQFTVQALPVNDAPETGSGSGSGEEGTLIAVSLSGTDVDGTVAAFVINSLPTNGTLYGSDGTTALQVGDEVAASSDEATVYYQSTTAGDFTFDFAAKDDGGAQDASPATATITVSPPPPPPPPSNPIAADDHVIAHSGSGPVVDYAALLFNDSNSGVNDPQQRLQVEVPAGQNGINDDSNAEHVGLQGATSFTYDVRDRTYSTLTSTTPGNVEIVIATGPNLVANDDGDHILITNRSGELMTGGTGRDVFTLGNNDAVDNNPSGIAPTITNYDADDAIYLPFLGEGVTAEPGPTSIDTYLRLAAGDGDEIVVEVDIDGGFDDPYVVGHLSNLSSTADHDVVVIWQRHQATVHYDGYIT